MHVLPNGFHRIRHYGLLASGTKAATIVRARELMETPWTGRQTEPVPRRRHRADLRRQEYRLSVCA